MNILKQIKKDYADFGDALITNVEYFAGFNFETKKNQEEEITITISCFNINKPFGESNELISLKCSDISYLNLKKYNGMIYQALLEKNENEYTIDFFPELIGKVEEDGLISKENNDSICIVKCKNIAFKLIANSMPITNSGYM